MVSQSEYESRLAVAQGFNFGSDVVSSQNRKFGDCSIASTTSCAPFRKSGSLRQQRLVALLLAGIQRTPERLLSELAHKTRPARGRTACRESAHAYRRRERPIAPASPRRCCSLPPAAAKGSARATGCGIR